MDDLLDLDFTKSAPSPANKSSQANYGSGRSAFDYLAKSTTTTLPPPRPASNGRSASPLQPQPQLKPNGAAGGDAFSSLFGTTSASSPAASTGTLSMAERLAKERTSSPSFGYASQPPSVSRSSSPMVPPPRNASSPSPSLPSSSSRLNFTPPLRSNAPSPALAPTTSLPAPSVTIMKRPSDPWDFDLLSSTVPSATKSSNPTVSTDPFDLGFEAPSPAPSRRPSSSATFSGEDDFDLLGAFSQPAQPPPTVSSSSQSPLPASRPTPSSQADVLSPPPELLLKLTTELGFPLPEANRALIDTFNETGKFGLEDAVERLMSGNAPGSVAEPRSEESSRKKVPKQREVDEWGEEENVRVGRRRSWEFEGNDDQDFEAERRRRNAQKQQQQQQQQSEIGGSREPRRGGKENLQPSDSKGEMDQAAKVLQDQASEVLAQAQKIGFSVFKSANAYWGAGKEALAKKLEEQRKAARIAAGLPGGSTNGNEESNGNNGRPKWWKEGMDLEEDENRGRPNGKGKQRQEPGTSGFKDSDDEEESARVDPVLPPRPTSSAKKTNGQPSQAAPSPPPPPSQAEYRSPFRRAKATSQPAPSSQLGEPDLLSGTNQALEQRSRPAASQSPVPPTSLRPTRPSLPNDRSSPTPPPPTRRPVNQLSSSALSQALSHKSNGNEHFKLGRFADASASYTLALEKLPRGWLGRIILLNNRAQSRLKSGEEKLAIRDCTEALEILLEPYGGNVDTNSLERETATGVEKEVREIGGTSGVDLRDQVGKSLGRRAKGYEVTEKWDMGLKDWEQVRNLGDEVVVKGAGGSKLIGDGIARCRKMLNPTQTPTPKPAASPRSPPTTTPTRSRPPPSKRPNVEGSGEAVKALQATQAAQLAEDDLRLELKDQVDARIISWKASKETNLRALIASLDNVLWPELGWKKVGMNELITESQLKVRYVRAIAKVHPDKLNAGNTTVEQRMIAGAVFGALNEAWNATKA